MITQEVRNALEVVSDNQQENICLLDNMGVLSFIPKSKWIEHREYQIKNGIESKELVPFEPLSIYLSKFIRDNSTYKSQDDYPEVLFPQDVSGFLNRVEVDLQKESDRMSVTSKMSELLSNGHIDMDMFIKISNLIYY